MKGPVLVTGPDRSGTTLMYALLAAHPDLAMVRRTNMWRWFWGKYGDLREADNLTRCLDAMVQYQRMEILGIDPDRVRRELASGPITYGRLFRTVQEHHAERRGRSRWGDKSLHTEHHANEVFRELPDAWMIHMLRDPRDRHASVVRRYDSGQRSRSGVIGRWVASTIAGERNRARHGYRYLLVRYEDLAREPEATLRHVCDAIELPYDPVMLTMRGALDTPEDDGGNSSFGRIEPGTISTSSIGRYRSVLSPTDIAVIDTLAGRPMRRHGYLPDGVDAAPAGVERAKFAATVLAPDAARLAGSLVRQPLERRRAMVPANRNRNRAED